MKIILTLLAPKIRRGARWAKMDAIVGGPHFDGFKMCLHGQMLHQIPQPFILYRLSICLPSCHHQLWNKLAELSLKIRLCDSTPSLISLWMGVSALYCKYPKNGTDWMKTMGFLVMPIYWRHSVTRQWDSKTSECVEAVPSANYD